MSEERVVEPRPESAGDLVLRQLRGLPAATRPGSATERRIRTERRRLTLWSVIYGGFRPRRRRARRAAETALPIVDWHDARLLAVAVAILLLCLLDAVLSVMFILGGGTELNPVMEKLISLDVTVFAVAKIAMTGLGIGVLVLLGKLRLFGAIRVVQSLYAVLVVYLVLVAYELLILSSYFTS